jgi:hypothetical protein
MMEEMEEEHEVQQQISEAISRPFGGDICDDVSEISSINSNNFFAPQATNCL